MHVTGEKKKGDGGPLRQRGAEERQPTLPASRSGHQEGEDPAHRCFLSLSLGLPSIPVRRQLNPQSAWRESGVFGLGGAQALGLFEKLFKVTIKCIQC